MQDRIKQILDVTGGGSGIGSYEVRQADVQNGRFDLVLPTEDQGRSRFDTFLFNTRTGQLENYGTADGTDYSWATKPSLDEGQAKQTAVAFLQKAIPVYAAQLAVSRIHLNISDGQVRMAPEYQLHFDRISSGIVVDQEYVDLSINAYTGRVDSMQSRLSEISYPSDAVPGISREQAKRLLLQLNDVELQYGWKDASHAGLFYRLRPNPSVPLFYTGAAPYLDANTGEWRDMLGNLVAVPIPSPAPWVDELVPRPQRIHYSAGIVLDGRTLPLEEQPVIREGVTLLPFRALLEAMKANVNWDAAHRRVTASKGAVQLELALDSKTALINGKEYSLEVPAQLVDSSTFVPARFVAEALGAKVDWEPESHLALIRSDGTAQPPTDAELKQWRLETELHWEAKIK